MKPSKYIIHDMYHVINNLELIHGTASKKQIYYHVKIAGKHDGRNYTDTQIQKTLNYLEIIGMIKQTEKGYGIK